MVSLFVSGVPDVSVVSVVSVVAGVANVAGVVDVEPIARAANRHQPKLGGQAGGRAIRRGEGGR